MKCSICGEFLPEFTPFEIINNVPYCGDCAFKRGLITDSEYIKNYLYWISLDGVRAVVFKDVIYVSTFNNPFQFEKKTQDFRKSEEYKNWRMRVFERDDFKCQVCGKVGGELNAHHIKEFSKYPELRFKVDNGITLCVKCHKKIHNRKKDD